MGPLALFLLTGTLSSLYCLVLILYRLFLSPISQFPGPKLAASTFWYEFYYDVYLQGRYTWKIKELHGKYGSIIRINPEELHIDDSTFYDQIYVNSSKRRTEKWHWSAKMFGTTTAAVGTIDHDLHRMRRAALNPYFSQASVGRLESTILSNVETLIARLRSFAGTGKAVNLSDAFTCLSADVIGSYAFGKSYGFLQHEDFMPRWRILMMDLSRSTHLMKQFGWLYKASTTIPECIVALIHPLTRELFKLRRSISRQIKNIKIDHKPDNKATNNPQTVFHGLLDSTLPPHELSTERLTEEALTIIGAGTVTTAHTLAVIFYHVLSNPQILSSLRKELHEIHLQHPKPTWNQLTQLPNLNAIINEGLRLSFGVSHRLQRVSPDTPLQYQDWTIPPGTPVSQTQMFIMTDPAIFSFPNDFLPQRWLDPNEYNQHDNNNNNNNNNSNKDEHTAMAFPDPKETKKYLVPFSRGSRSCLGINLAYAELFLTVGMLLAPVEFGGLELRLFETGPEEMEIEHDFFNPSPKVGSKGVRVIVL
ncbi:cytochrome P450 monooxygenase [Tothia fuscella]|uniref:Cytochrome P450 monooxygenase n=1 Tax=Tothia fuscella TaxID=1048955 RepID=A0A9P4TTE2_9PEZI|nr:cytochrome P450 monooxygenase [Tothia fuscella]